MTLRSTSGLYPLARDSGSTRLYSSSTPFGPDTPAVGSSQGPGPNVEDTSRRLAYTARSAAGVLPAATTTSPSFPYGIHTGQPMRQGYFDHNSHYQGLVSDDRLLLQPSLSTGPQANGLAVSAAQLGNSVDSSGTWGMNLNPGVMLPAPGGLASSEDMNRRNLQVPVAEPMYRRSHMDGNGPGMLDTRLASLEGVGYDSTASGLRSSFGTSATTSTSPSDDSSKATTASVTGTTAATASTTTPTTDSKTDSATAASDPSPSSGSKASKSGSASASTGGVIDAGTGGGSGTTLKRSRKSVTPGLVTVGDIVSRTIHERRKRPIPASPEKLVQLDAPIPPRRKMFKAPSTEEHKEGADADVGIQLQRGSKRKYKASETVGDAEAKRIRNTLAARRHRLYKAAQWRDMQVQVEQLRARNEELEALLRTGDMAQICAENAKLMEQVYSLEYERRILIARIEGHNGMVRMDDPRRDMPY